MKPGVFSSGNILDHAYDSSGKVTAYRGQFTTVNKPTAPSVSTLSGMRSATLQPRSTMQQKHLLPVEPFQGFLVFERDLPPKCSWKMLLLIQLNWVIAFLFTPLPPATLPSVIVFQNVIILYSFPTPFSIAMLVMIHLYISVIQTRGRIRNEGLDMKAEVKLP